MSTFQVLERHLREEIQERVPLSATCVVVHSTANPGATDETHFKWLDSARRHGWAHYYLDWDSISQLVPEGFVAPANGPTFNKKAISLEICEPPTNLPQAERQHLFTEAWNRATWLVAEILSRYGWGVNQVFSHAKVSELHPVETDHTDPISFFAAYNRSWADFLTAVALQLTSSEGLPPAAPWQEEVITRMMNTKLPNGEPFLTQRRHPNQPVTWWELGIMLERSRKLRSDGN